MSLQAFQHAVVELTLAPDLADRLGRGDAGVLASYDLTDRERDRLMAVAGQRGMAVHRTLARGNRLEVIFAAFPMSCILLRPVLRALVDELWAAHRPAHYQLTEEADVFVALVERKMTDGTLAVEYLPEIFGYEFACRALTREARDDPDATFETTVEFEHDPDGLLPPLSRLESPPSGLPPRPCGVTVRLQGGTFSYQVVERA